MSSQARKQLQGPRPAPLTVRKSSTKIKKPIPSSGKSRSPVIVYLQSPKVIHVRPEEFIGMVQRLTGKQAPSTAAAAAADSHSYYSYKSCRRPADETMGMGIISSDGSNQKHYNSGVQYGVDPFLETSSTSSDFDSYSEAFWVNLDL